MKWLLFGWLVLLVVLAGVHRFYPSGKDLKPDARGMIHHPVYGTYPAQVEYKQGMTLMPGQTASIGVAIRMDGEKKR